MATLEELKKEADRIVSGYRTFLSLGKNTRPVLCPITDEGVGHIDIPMNSEEDEAALMELMEGKAREPGVSAMILVMLAMTAPGDDIPEDTREKLSLEDIETLQGSSEAIVALIHVKRNGVSYLKHVPFTRDDNGVSAIDLGWQVLTVYEGLFDNPFSNVEENADSQK